MKGVVDLAINRKALREALKSRYMSGIIEHLENCGEEVLRTASNEVAIPCVDDDGNDEWLVLTFKVPTGSRDDEPYDGYSVAEDYEIKQKNKAEKAEKAAAAKAKKIERDKAAREARAKAKAEHKEKEGK